MFRSKVVVTMAAALALAVSGCGGGSGSGSGSGSGAAKGPIKIGISMPLTGSESEPGKAAVEGYKVWEAVMNANGGLLGRKVKLIIKDDASSQNTVVSDYTSLISRDKVDLLLGTFSSLLNIPASTVAERNRMLYVEPAGGAPEIFQRGYKMIFFAQQATSDRQGVPFAQWVMSLPPDQRPKTAAYPTLDDPFAIPVVEGIRKILEAGGVRTVQSSRYPIDTSNFDSIANAVKGAKPDLIVHGAQFADGVGFLRALKKVGYTPKMIFQTSAPSFGNQYSEGVGVDRTQGVMYGVSYDEGANTPGNAEFVAQYKKMYGNQPIIEDSANAYGAGQVLTAAVNAIGTVDRASQPKMADWLRKNAVDTVMGRLAWDATGAPTGDFLVGQWQNGKTQIVLPKNLSTTDTIITTYLGSG